MDYKDNPIWLQNTPNGLRERGFFLENMRRTITTVLAAMVVVLTMVKLESPWMIFFTQITALVLSYIAWSKEENPWIKIDEIVMEELTSTMTLIYEEGHDFKLFKDGENFIAFKQDDKGFYIKTL